MLTRASFHVVRASKRPVPQPLTRAYSNGSPPSSMGTSRPGWFRTEQERTRALWATAILATVGGWWYMTREPNARKEYENVKQGMRGSSASSSDSSNK
ncbi:hypothetical protein JCM10296v2_005672 [Rhodotorula toruloides]